MVVSSNDLGSGFPTYQVPRRTITIDGAVGDWAGISPAINDATGDGGVLPGSDIAALYLARDDQNIYLRLTLANGMPSPSLFFGISFQRNDNEGDRFVFIQMSQLRCSVDQWTSDNFHIPVANGSVAINDGIIEASVPANALNLPSPSIVSAWSDTSGPSIDDTAAVQLLWP